MEPSERRQSSMSSPFQQRKSSIDNAKNFQPPSALEVSRERRFVQVIVAIIYSLLAGGVVFGFAALKPILVEEGVYRDKCSKRDFDDNVDVCYEQELRLNLIFTVAAVSTNICALPAGTVLDRFGPRIASLIGVFFLTIGTLVLAFAVDLPFDGYIPGYLCLALGGSFVFIPSFHLSNAFPRNSGLVLALLTGAFDASSVVFLLFRILYGASGGSFTPKRFFLLYLVVPAFILLAQLLIMPEQSYQNARQVIQQAEDSTTDVHESDDEIEDDQHRVEIQRMRQDHRESIASEMTALLGATSSDEQMQQETQKAQQSGVWGVLHGYTAPQQIATPWFLLIALFTIVQMLRINYFVATIRTQYAYLLGSMDEAAHINEVFDVILPIGGVIAVPLIGFLLDRTSTAFVMTFLVGIATLIGILGVIPNTYAAYANITFFALYRPLYYTAVSDYAAKVFGFVTFGKVYGLIICLAGIFNFTQAGLDTLNHRVFRGDFIPVNLILLGVALLAGAFLMGFVWAQTLHLRRQRSSAFEGNGHVVTQELLDDGGGGEAGERMESGTRYGTA